MGTILIIWDPREANSHFSSTQLDWGPDHHVKAAVDWCGLGAARNLARRCCIIGIALVFALKRSMSYKSHEALNH